MAESVTSIDTPQNPFAPHSLQAFDEPWMRRVREVDDAVLSGLLRTLIGMRRIKLIVALCACTLGAAFFGALRVAVPVYALLIYGTLAAGLGMPIFAGASLAVRRLFLREATCNGVSRSAAMLILTRAERRARFLSPLRPVDEKVDMLLQAVRDPDTA